MRRWISIVAACGCMILSIGLYSCGSDSDSPATGAATPAPAPRPVDASAVTAYLVDESDVNATQEDSPDRALLQWWQLMQYAAYDRAYGLLSAKVKQDRSPARWRKLAKLAAVGGFTGKPQVASRYETGAGVDLAVNILLFKAGQPVAAVPRIFSLVREDGAWRIASLAYVELKAQEAQAARG